MILLPQKWKRQPTVPMAVDWNHPLAQGLIEFGYALPGLVPYSAVAVGSQRPFVTGAGTQDATTNGQAITVNGTGNYIDLGRNISAPTLVASGFVRTTFHGVGSMLLTTAQQSGSNYAGHYLIANANGALDANYGDNAGSGGQNRRTAASAAGVLVSGETFSVGFVCRGEADFALLKNGGNLGSLSYSGSASSYSGGTARGTINFRQPATAYGQQSSSTWAFWSRALNDGEMQALHEAPFQLLVKRQRRIWVAVGSAAGGASATAATAWRIRAAQQAGSAWRIRAAAPAATAWRVRGAVVRVTAWRIKAAAAASAAWRVLGSLPRAVAWRIRAAAAPTAWRIRTALTAGTGWRIRQALAQALGWRIGALLLPAPHQVLQATRHARTLYATTHPPTVTRKEIAHGRDPRLPPHRRRQ